MRKKEIIMKRTKLIGVFSLVAFVIAVILSVLDATVLATRAINPILFGLDSDLRRYRALYILEENGFRYVKL